MLRKILAAKRRMIPKDGANLVGVDTFEEPGDELYLIGHFETKAEAESAQAERKKRFPDERTFVYEPDTE